LIRTVNSCKIWWDWWGAQWLQPFVVEALMSCSFPWDVNGRSSSMLGGVDQMFAL
jgi:hypothetical protein